MRKLVLSLLLFPFFVLSQNTFNGFSDKFIIHNFIEHMKNHGDFDITKIEKSDLRVEKINNYTYNVIYMKKYKNTKYICRNCNGNGETKEYSIFDSNYRIRKCYECYGKGEFDDYHLGSEGIKRRYGWSDNKFLEKVKKIEESEIYDKYYKMKFTQDRSKFQVFW